MSIGMILLSVVAVLVLLGVAQRVLDKMYLTDRAALVIIAAIFVGGLIPNIPLGLVEINLGGCLIPLGVCIWLLIKAGTVKEKVRALIGAVLTGGAVFAMGVFLPNEPEVIGIIDPNYTYGIAAGVLAYLLGRSRRGAFICGVMGVILADIAVAIVNWSNGIRQTLVLGGAGVMDVIVLSGLIGVLLAELVGELIERIVRHNKRENADPIQNPVVRRRVK